MLLSNGRVCVCKYVGSVIGLRCYSSSSLTVEDDCDPERGGDGGCGCSCPSCCVYVVSAYDDGGGGGGGSGK